MQKPFSERKQAIIELLARFKYLTVSQFLALDVAKHGSNLRLSLKDLMDEGFIDFISFGVSAEYGRLENFYFLKAKGVDLLGQIQERIYPECGPKAPKNLSTLFYSDYSHRKATINFNIEFFKWSLANQVQVEFVDYYFDTLGSNKGKSEVSLTSKNKIQLEHTSITPDIIAKIEGTGRDYLFAVEIHRGNDTNRLIKQILWHCDAASIGAIQAKYDYARAVKTYVILDNIDLLPYVCAKLSAKTEFEPFAPSFLFSSLAELQQDFFGAWRTCEGTQQNFIV
jgi:hypothetical protein